MVDYDDITLQQTNNIDNDDVDDIHDRIDNMQMAMPVLSDDGLDEYIDTDEVTLPDTFDVAHEKWMKNPNIPADQKVLFDSDWVFYGAHVPNSNTKRSDNLRHFMDMELENMYSRIPTRRDRALLIKKFTVSEFQMCRSNPEIGGFDRKMDRSVIKREDVDVKQMQTLFDANKQPKKRRSGVLSFLSRKNKGE